MTKHTRRELKRQFALAPGYIVMAGWLLLTVLLIGWLLLASLSTTREVFTDSLLASGLHFENYGEVLVTHNMGVYFLNSLLYSIAGCVGTVLIGAPAAYVLGRFHFPGRAVVVNGFVLLMSIPTVMLILPLFKMAAQLHLTGSRWVLMILYIGLNVPFSIFFLSSFFAGLPKALEEAAEIDGCTAAGAFWRIMFPLAQPGIVTLCIINFINIWNEYFMAKIFSTSKSMYTVSTGLQLIIESMKMIGNWAQLFAGVMLVFLPTFFLFVFLSKKIMAGITGGAVKE